jgi:ribosomal protein S18 acetylase RimI-like enzyme
MDLSETIPFQTRDGEALVARRLGAGDAPAMQRFHAALLPESRRRFLPHRYDDATLAQVLARSVAGADLTLGLFAGERLAGYFFLWYFRERVPLLGIGLLDEYQQRGLGKPMMELLIRLARESGKEGIELTTMLDNHNAFALYQKVGFRYLQDVQNVIGDGTVVVERAMFYEIVPGARPFDRPHQAPV